MSVRPAKPMNAINIKRFADGEIYIQLRESVRGCDVFLVRPTCPAANENIMELLVMIDDCRRALAKTVTAVIPYFGYARADRKDNTVNSSVNSRDDIEHRQCQLLNNPDLEMRERHIKNMILQDIDAILHTNGRYGGTGKTYVWKTLFAAFRCKGESAKCYSKFRFAALLSMIFVLDHS
ncbi:ribose-phosphate diphosphokinase [Tanacetum coccineum]